MQVPVPDGDLVLVEVAEEERPGEGETEEAERSTERKGAPEAAEKGPRVSARPSFRFWGTGCSDAAPTAVSSLHRDSSCHGSGQHASGGLFHLLADTASDGGASAPLLHSTKLRALMAVQEGSASARLCHVHQARYE